VPLLVRPKFSELTEHIARSKPSHENLPSIDINRAVLSGVVDPDDAIGKAFFGYRQSF